MSPDPARDGYIQLIQARPDIGGRFLQPTHIGDGHFSLVFRARDNTTNRDVAVKVFRPDRLSVDPYRFQCFCREAMILEQIAGTANVIGWVSPREELVEAVMSSTGIHFGELRFPYYVVELASTDLGTIIRSGSWGFEQKLLAFREMCKAGQRIHNMRIVHRDIKPSNFLVMANGDIKLSDFGTARRVDGREAPILPSYIFAPGDIRYVAPEMHALLHDDDPAIATRADIFALGATLFEMCTGATLVVQIFDARFAIDLAQAMGAIQTRDRKRIYLQLLQSLDAAHPLPSMAAYAGNVPGCIRSQLDSLYKGMAALDYRKRLCDLDTIFLKINQCILQLKNEAKIAQWRRQKQIYKANRNAKLARRENFTLMQRGELP
jgi:serine/threonine protein kinase